MNNVVIKSFDELDKAELYEILEARMKVFVVEQQCPYQDIDAMDYDGVHLYIKKDEKISAYLRIIDKEPSEKLVQIGRVLTLERGTGLGAEILKAGISAAADRLGAERIYIEAQVYAKGFYEKEGFAASGDEFLEDGIPHVPMMLELENNPAVCAGGR
ncbi:MAG: GNAT family N-acetyltransferase [Lentihominibacter sp.]